MTRSTAQWRLLVPLVLAALGPACNCGKTAPKVVQHPKAAGETCSADSECQSGECAVVPPGLVKTCATPCDKGCPAGQRCVQAGNNDKGPVYACSSVPADPCGGLDGGALDCGTDNDKVLLLDGDLVCGQDCSGDGKCPPGFDCTTATDKNGQPVQHQCVPKSGTCKCTSASEGQGLPCTKTNTFGTCHGFQTCHALTGYGECDARVPSAEVCDGVDNDCDGQVDNNLGTTTCGDGPCQVTVDNCKDGHPQACTPDMSKATTEVCDGIDNNCNGRVDEGFDLNSDIHNCNACGHVCPAINGVPYCSGGVCGVTCTGTYKDCNHQAFDGCESDTQTDANNCGGCGNACNFPHASGSCVDGGCQMGSCDPNYWQLDGGGAGCNYYCVYQGVTEVCNGLDDNCDGRVDEGFDLLTDVNNCGRCGTVCPSQNGTALCDTGACSIQCAQGFANCDNVLSDGCEINTQTDADHCGGCLNHCSYAHAQAGCDAGGCEMGPCDPNYLDMDGLPSTGCEYYCVYQGALDLPDLQLGDANCDGIDGEVSNGVFVAPTPLGNDGNDGSMAHPKATPNAAIQLAASSGKRDVYISAGTYLGQVQLASGVSVYGGYQATDHWSRSASNVVTFTGHVTPLYAFNVSGATVQLLTVVGSSATGAGATAMAVQFIGSNNITMEAVTVQAGNGQPGSDGANGSKGADGLVGSDGDKGVEDSSGFCSSGSQPQGGAAGTNAYCAGANGGRGGNAEKDDNTGDNGSPSPGGAAGGPGRPAHFGNTYDPTYYGQDGWTPGTGTDGAGGNSVGTFSLTSYSVASGADGSAGPDGVGGGGGGGGGGGTVDCNSYGAGGGGGGAGGCGGTKATKGQGGGASVAVFVSNTDLIVRACTFTAGNGGNGGKGGQGGAGGLGKNGGGSPYGGSSEQDDGSNGGLGGHGGDGGRGGHGGGGGGGPSIAVVTVGTAIFSADSATSLVAGSPGAGGSMSFGGNAGAQGMTAGQYP